MRGAVFELKRSPIVSAYFQSVLPAVTTHQKALISVAGAKDFECQKLS
jgi:hypothetical protein